MPYKGPEKVKAYNKERRIKQKEKLVRQQKEYYLNNKEVIAEKAKIKYQANKQSIRSQQAEYTKLNKDKFNNRTALRYANKMQATLKCFKPKDFLPFYTLARLKTEQTGIQHHVDHIHPLQGEFICGLHVPNNLQVIPQFENIRKSNKFLPYVESEE